jgi:hypothetical protein
MFDSGRKLFEIGHPQTKQRQHKTLIEKQLQQWQADCLFN